MSEINIGASRFANRIPIPNPKEDARHRLFCVEIDHHCSDIKLELNRKLRFPWNTGESLQRVFYIKTIPDTNQKVCPRVILPSIFSQQAIHYFYTRTYRGSFQKHK